MKFTITASGHLIVQITSAQKSQCSDALRREAVRGGSRPVMKPPWNAKVAVLVVTIRRIIDLQQISRTVTEEGGKTQLIAHFERRP
ncbi:hypothetical protein [Cupriavidus necator]|uniref:hypothetical protein n=1 Tax=Cupriavidus necator TaxID=106590 RepID=UPI0038B358BB